MADQGPSVDVSSTPLFAGSSVDAGVGSEKSLDPLKSDKLILSSFETTIQIPAKTYLMIGMDAVLSGVYGTWEVTGSPDYAGTQAGSASPPITLPARNVSVLG